MMTQRIKPKPTCDDNDVDDDDEDDSLSCFLMIFLQM